MLVEIPSRYTFPSPGFSNYWHFGRGRKLASKINNHFPTEAEISEKIPSLFVVDELGDAVVREVMLPYGFSQTLQWINQSLAGQTKDIPQKLIDLIDFSIRKPDWLDTAKLEKGAKLCRRSGTRGFMVLRNYCLMGGYESSAINKPLIFTGALKKGAAKRTTETTEFWVKITAKNALESNDGIKECILIRLMHAYSRVSILAGDGWKKEQWGEPLNQWDMIATNLGFSQVFLDGIKSLGVLPKNEEIEGLFHFWKYVGHLLGIPAEHLPNNEQEAIRELYSWTITQPPADEDTKALAKALMEEPHTSNFPPKEWQKKRALKIHLAYNYFFLGADSCKAMGLPVRRWSIFPYALKGITKIQEWYFKTSDNAFENGVKKRRDVQEKVASLYLGSNARNSH